MAAHSPAADRIAAVHGAVVAAVDSGMIAAVAVGGRFVAADHDVADSHHCSQEAKVNLPLSVGGRRDFEV